MKNGKMWSLWTGFSIFQLDLGGRWSLLTGGRCSEVDLALKFVGPDLEWSLLTGGSEVVVSTGLTVHPKSVVPNRV